MSLALSVPIRVASEARPQRGLSQGSAGVGGFAQSQSRMKDIEDPKALNCLTLVYYFHSNQGRCTGVDERVQCGFLKGSFLRPK